MGLLLSVGSNVVYTLASSDRRNKPKTGQNISWNRVNNNLFVLYYNIKSIQTLPGYLSVCAKCAGVIDVIECPILLCVGGDSNGGGGGCG